MISDAEFKETSKMIVATLRDRSSEMDKDEQIRFVYNNGIEDAIEFACELARMNLMHRQSIMLLVEEVRLYLPLRTDDTPPSAARTDDTDGS